MSERKTYIINVDGMRSDYFNTVGHQGCLTPTIALLAKKGTIFKNCKSIMPANTNNKSLAGNI